MTVSHIENADVLAESQFVEVNGVRTRFIDVGSGPVIVLLHGGDFRSASSLDDWSLNLGGLSRDFRVVALDKLGQGFTDVPADDSQYTMTATIDHFRAFLDALGIERATLVGHSRGALPVAAVAIDQPDRVESLIIFDSNTLAPEHPLTPKDFYPTAYANRPSPPDVEFVRRELVMNSFSDAHVDADLVARRLTIAAFPKTAVAVEKMKALYELQFLPSYHSERDRVLDVIRKDGLPCPVLVIWGNDDPSAPLPLAWDLVELIGVNTPWTEFHLVNQAGHYPYRERPDACNGVLGEFARRVIDFG